MEMRSWSWLRLMVAAATWWQVAKCADTQDYRMVCSGEPARNVTEFVNNVNATFSGLRAQLSEAKRFATAYANTSHPEVYGMTQCRNYMSESDCLACYDAAVSAIRNCSNAYVTEARFFSNDCSLRYADFDFYKDSTDNGVECSNLTSRSAADLSKFVAAGERLVGDLARATPETGDYYAASRRGMGSAENTTIYGVAQCAQTIIKEHCRICLSEAYVSLQNCISYSADDGRAWGTACFIRYSNTTLFADHQITDIQRYIGRDSITGPIIGGVAAATLLILSFALLWYKYSKQLRKALIGNILGATELQGPKRYSYKDLKAATNGFSDDNKLGQGAFGIVYKACLVNGSVVAVKKLEMSNRRAKEDFETEVKLISNVHHRNLTRLLGCCTKGSQLLLVLEYVENGSLDTFLYGDRRGSLSWKQRLDIIFGTAKGIAYLHEHYYSTMIHRDIKPANILIDSQFQAKIADFGLAKLLPDSQTHLSSVGFAGTLGYTAPEYAIHGHLSEKVDVYSFGLVVLEIISGQRCTDFNPASESEYLLKKAWELYEVDMHQKLAEDALLVSNGFEEEEEEVKKMVEIGLMCTQSPPSSRPTMSQILTMLVKEQRPPLRRPDFVQSEAVDDASASASA